MLNDSIIAEIQRLLAKGRLPRRQIALSVGVARATVDSVAAGRRTLRGIDRDAGRQAAVRCPGCGVKVHGPCVLCPARNHRRRTSILRLSAPPGHNGRPPRRAA